MGFLLTFVEWVFKVAHFIDRSRAHALLFHDFAGVDIITMPAKCQFSQPIISGHFSFHIQTFFYVATNLAI